MIPVEEAQERVLAEVQALGTEQVAFTDALGRVLREDVRARVDVPQGDNTAMDGYAVRAEDIANAPVELRVVENLPAGTVARYIQLKATMTIKQVNNSLGDRYWAIGEMNVYP